MLAAVVCGSRSHSDSPLSRLETTFIILLNIHTKSFPTDYSMHVKLLKNERVKGSWTDACLQSMGNTRLLHGLGICSKIFARYVATTLEDAESLRKLKGAFLLGVYYLLMGMCLYI